MGITDSVNQGQEAPDSKDWLRDQAAGVRTALRGAASAGIASGMATIVQAGAMAWLVHWVVIDDAPLAEAWRALGLLVLAVLARAVLHWLHDRASRAASDRVRARVREDILATWAQSGPARLGEQNRAGLTTALVEQVDALHGYFARFLPQLIIALWVPLVIGLVVLRLDWLAALFLFLSAPLIPLFMALVGMGAERLNASHFALVQRLAGHFTDRIRGLTTLQLFGQTRTATRQVYAAAEEYRRLNMRTLRVAFLSTAVLEFFASVAIAVVAIYIGFGLLGYIDFGPSTDLTLFSGLFILLLAPEFFQPLRVLAQHYHDRAAALGAATLLAPALSGVANTLSGSAARSPLSASAGPVIDVNSVCFRFANESPLLVSADLSLSAGTWTTIGGASGSGKSTLLHIIAGFLSPASGSVRVCGRHAGDVSIGWLDQSPFLLAGSWADNLRLHCPDATDTELLDALQKVGLLQRLIASADGLAATIGDRGFGLSGGEARRLALARLFLQNHPLILLDEPTAGLDRENERAVLNALKHLRQAGIAILSVSHHAAPAQYADRAMTLQDGQLHEI